MNHSTKESSFMSERPYEMNEEFQQNEFLHYDFNMYDANKKDKIGHNKQRSYKKIEKKQKKGRQFSFKKEKTLREDPGLKTDKKLAKGISKLKFYRR